MKSLASAIKLSNGPKIQIIYAVDVENGFYLDLVYESYIFIYLLHKEKVFFVNRPNRFIPWYDGILAAVRRALQHNSLASHGYPSQESLCF